jgi:phasin family protein
MKLAPTMDFSSFANVVKKNAEILTSSSQMVVGSLQSIVKRSAEVFQNNASDMLNAIKDTASSQDLEQMAAHQQKYVKSTLENSINNAKEIMDMSSKSSMEIFEVVGKNMSENINKSFSNFKPKA